ncbi:hypothetical protein LINGRAHAP2_LOCUS32305 [Linum grandiflorum]
MGSCFSSSSLSPPPPPTAKVVSINGDLREYAPPVSVSQVLTTSSADYFLCNSDLLSYDQPIPALPSDVLLIPNQLYFLLPISKLNSKLTAPDMAALAVRASQAIQSSNRGRKKSSSISPVLFVDDDVHRDQESDLATLLMLQSQKPKAEAASFQQSGGGGQFRKSRSIRKLQRYASRRAKLAVRSFRLGLATIYEGTAL